MYLLERVCHDFNPVVQYLAPYTVSYWEWGVWAVVGMALYLSFYTLVCMRVSYSRTVPVIPSLMGMALSGLFGLPGLAVMLTITSLFVFAAV
ncbi:hypothetical protein ACJU26_08650 [Acidithiobacillus sp. M4-SHS-6]|uniref:hypothetical protein n=1 Tax=Acidithiobacillus sp. M4-SHS-6 TaxID=3383024 RepID=UPI0039BDC123